MTTIQTGTALDAALKDSGLQAESAATLLEVFQPYFNRAAQINFDANGLKVTDATQVAEMKKAREFRLALREVRIESEKVRKAQKEDSLRRGQAIDKVAKVIVNMTEPAEAMLLDMECFAERAEAARKAALKAEREKLLAPYGVDTALYALGDMAPAQWDALLTGTRLAHEAKIAADAKAEADRLEAERVRRENEAKLKAENERLAAENRAIQEKADQERRVAEAKAKEERRQLEEAAAKERQAREKLEREAQERAAAEAKQRKADEAAARKAARAPDKVKLQAVADAVRAIVVPEVASMESKAVRNNIVAKVEGFAVWIESQIATLD